MSRRLAVVETHPIQYHAPLYRMLEQEFGLPVTAIYGSDFSVAGYHDAEFGASFQWDTDLLSGYDARFLATVAAGGARSWDTATTRGLGEALDAVNPSAVMLVGYSPCFYRDAFLTAWRRKVPLLFRGETTDHALRRNAVKGTVRGLALWWFYTRFAALLYVGKRSREHFEGRGVPQARLFFSPYCVDTAPFRPDERDDLRRQTRAEFGLRDGKVILFVGKLSPRKAPELLVQAVKKLAQTERDCVTLVFVGDGEMRQALGQLASEPPVVGAVFAGFQNQTQLSRFYHAADVLVLPSRTMETWGLVVNEALYHGVPCVVSDRVGCAPDLVTAGETGQVFRSDDVDGLANGLKQALGYAGTEATRAACMRRANAYAMRRAAAGIVQAFSHATGEKPAGAQ